MQRKLMRGIKMLVFLNLIIGTFFSAWKLYLLYMTQPRLIIYSDFIFRLKTDWVAFTLFAVALCSYIILTLLDIYKSKMAEEADSIESFMYKLLTPFGPFYAKVLPAFMNNLTWNVGCSSDMQSEYSAILELCDSDEEVTRDSFSWEQLREMLDIIGFPKDSHLNEITSVRENLSGHFQEQPFSIIDGDQSKLPPKAPAGFTWMHRRFKANSFNLKENVVSYRDKFWFLVRAPE